LELNHRHIRQQLAGVMSQHQHTLRRKLDQAQKLPDEQREAAVCAIHTQIIASQDQVAQRRLSLPVIDYPLDLPVVASKDEIAKAIADHQVVIVAGETGSGKTTQLPKICLELGLGQRGFIGHTQPRRLAARSVAARIAEELKVEPGEQVGYKVRFSDKVGPRTLIKLMTDGILLAELQQDRFLSQYEVLIIDEAHERSLNIDFILGYLRHLLAKRPDLKVIITSATIDPERFSKHFNDAPMLLVEGRTYPVETRYRPLSEGDQTRDMIDAINDAVDELSREKPGDILIFMNGEREIRDTAEALNKRALPNTEVLPLFSRLSNAEQNRIFSSHRGRRIVLATNVAETSLTVPGIRYVIDPGTARISRYSARAKVQRLPIEAISQASANQRKGRCGRVAEGICIRLYDEADFLGRPEFTDPEIRRTNLASVILQMLALRLGEIAQFPFIDPPDDRNITDGVRLLEELGALKTAKGSELQLSQVGHALAKLPLDPRLGRMLLASLDFNCLDEVMVICAGLSVQDPRERPTERRQASDEAHRRFADPDSDFAAYLNLWRYIQEQQQELSQNQFRKLCQKEFLAYLRVREWQDIYQQLRLAARDLGWKRNQTPGDFDAIHQAITAGLLSHIGFKDKEREFLGARNTRFVVFPGSGLSKKPPKWLVASELVETSRLFARDVAKINPQWLESLAAHLIKKSHSEPHWSVKNANVMAYETQTLYGIAIVVRRLVNYAHIDPKDARSIFIRSGLIEGGWKTKLPFMRANQTLLDEVEDFEHKSRRRDIRVDDQILFEFYDERLPMDVVSPRHLEAWWKGQKYKTPDLLNYEKSALLKRDVDDITSGQYPETWQQGTLQLPLSYVFEPSASDDGVSVTIPLALLNQIEEKPFDWLIPAFREELIIALIKSLPKSLRRNFVPAPNFAKACMESMPIGEGRLLEAVTKQLLHMTAVRVPDDAWDLTQIPDHLKMNFKVAQGIKLLGEGRDLSALKHKLQGRVDQQLSQTAKSQNIEQQGLTEWSMGLLPETIETKQTGFQIRSYPALKDDGDSVAVQVFDKPEVAQMIHRSGVRRLLLLNVPSPLKYLQLKLPNRAKLGLYFNPFGKVEMLIEDCCLAALDSLVDAAAIRSDDAFNQARERVRAELADTTLVLAQQVEQVLSLRHEIAKKLKGKVSLDQVMAQADIKSQLENLVYRGFVVQTGAAKMPDLQRYLKAIHRRLEKLPVDPHKDRLVMIQLQGPIDAYQALSSQLKNNPLAGRYLQEVQWMLEELRVSLYAQQLGTAYPISAKRIHNHIDALKKELAS
jgi:ATP-dependent helicase HrpA